MAGAGAPRSLLLVVDTGSPVASVAVGPPGGIAALAAVPQAESAERLPALIEEVLAAAGTRLRDLAGLVALQGPGSFTGLRVGMATVLGFHQAIGLPATALPTLEVLAACPGLPADRPVVAVVDARRGEWLARPFAPGGGAPLAPAALRRPEELAAWGPAAVCGCLLGELVAALPPGVQPVESGPLAGVALLLLGRRPIDFDPARLVAPLYSRPPAAAPIPPRAAADAPARCP